MGRILGIILIVVGLTIAISSPIAFIAMLALCVWEIIQMVNGEASVTFGSIFGLCLMYFLREIAAVIVFAIGMITTVAGFYLAGKE